MATLTVPESMSDADSVEVMADYADSPERVRVDHNGIPRDAKGSAFSTDSYWVVADSGVER
jgi:hypothetical protein